MGDIEPGEWGTALGDDKLTEAIIERVVRTPRTRRKADTSVPPRPTAGLRLGARPPCGGSRIPLPWRTRLGQLSWPTPACRASLWVCPDRQRAGVSCG